MVVIELSVVGVVPIVVLTISAIELIDFIVIMITGIIAIFDYEVS